jgi:hypothetical protein
MIMSQATFTPRIIGIGGTVRPHSTSERAVAEALRCAEKIGARTQLFNGEFISRLPLYAPDRTCRSSDESEFLEAARSCHGIIVGTPGYHGSLSGPIKNILDLLEDTARDDTPYLRLWMRGHRLWVAGLRDYVNIAAHDRARLACMANAIWCDTQCFNSVVQH